MPVCIPLATGLLGVLVWPSYLKLLIRKRKSICTRRFGERKEAFLVCQNHLEALILLELYKQKLFERATIGLSMAASCGLVALTGPTSDWSLLELIQTKEEMVSPVS